MTKATLPERVVVVSPHLDDAVLSLGAGIAHATRNGSEIRVVTVFANDPDSDRATSDWDREAGFSSAREAALARREEDARACALVGAIPTWLPFADDDHGGEPDEELMRARLDEAIADVEADAVLLPGYPLAHPDHGRLTFSLLSTPPSAVRLGLYVEQPYAAWRHIGRGRRTWAAKDLTLSRGLHNLASMLLHTERGRELQAPTLDEAVVHQTTREPVWAALEAGRRDRSSKRLALREYESQFRGFGRHTRQLIALYERGWGGEGLAWLSAPERG
jgi:LmbE family N-acetylglucosaminyl deacetylase